MHNIFSDLGSWAVAQFLTPLIMSLVVGAAAAVVGWAGVLYSRLTGSKLDEKHQRSLQSALENGMKYAIQVVLKGRLPINMDAVTQQRLVSTATEYAKQSVPDAMNHFHLLDKKTGETDNYAMERLLLPKMPVIDATTSIPPATAIAPNNGPTPARQNVTAPAKRPVVKKAAPMKAARKKTA